MIYGEQEQKAGEYILENLATGEQEKINFSK